MADPRTTRLEGQGQLRLSFPIDNSTITYSATTANGSASVGKAVTLETDGTISLADTGEHVLGRLELVEADDTATVTVAGIVRFTFSASSTAGRKIVGGATAGTVATAAAADNSEAEMGLATGLIIDHGVTADVAVLL